MKRRLNRTGVLLIALVGIASAQTIEWSAKDPRCSERWLDGGLFRVIKVGDLHVEVVLADTGNYLRAGLMVSTGSTVTLFPDRITMRDSKGKEIASLPPEKVMKRISKLEAISAMAGGAAQGWTDASAQRKVGTATSRSSDGTVTHTDVYESPAARPPAQNDDLRAKAAANEDYNAWVNRVSLRNTTLDPGDNITGLVWFPREKKKQEVTISVPLGSYTFVFRMTPQ